MNDIAENGAYITASINGQEWRVDRYPPSDAAPGRPHDAEVMDCRLLGFSRGVCVHGPEEGLVLVRSMWRAEVRLAPWDPRFEMAHRRLLPAEEVFRSVAIPGGLGPFYRRLLAEAAIHNH